MIRHLFRNLAPSISRALLLRMAALVVLTCAAFAGALYFLVLKPTLHELGASEIQRATEQVKGQVGNLVEQIERVARTARQWGLREQFNLYEVQAFNRMFIPILEQHSLITAAIFADDRGQEILLLKMPNGEWHNRITDLRKWGARQRWLKWRDGGELLGEEWRESDYNPLQRPWHIGAMSLARESDVYWTEPYVFYTTRDPGVTAAVKWHDATSATSYVLALDVKLLDLSRFTAGLRFAVDGRSALVAEDGRIVAVPRAPSTASDDGIPSTVLKTPESTGRKLVFAAVNVTK